MLDTHLRASHPKRQPSQPTDSMGQPRIPDSLAPLPTELHLEIICQLSILDRFKLRFINRHFFNTIPCPATSDHLEIEKCSALLARFLTCNCCNRLLPIRKFAEDVPEAGSPFASSRYCLECGFNPRPTLQCGNLAKFQDRSWYQKEDTCWHRYDSSQRPFRNGRHVILCTRCKEIKPRNYGRYAEYYCEDCWVEKDERLT